MELYLCLTRPVQSGTLYVGDLRIDNARRNGSVDPPAQNRYLRNPDQTPVTIARDGRLLLKAYGIGAYLAGRVAPGGAGDPSMTVTVLGAQTGDQIQFGTMLQIQAGVKEDAAAKTFKDSATAGSDDASAASLASILNDPAILAQLVVGLKVTKATVTVAKNVVTIKTDPPSQTPTVVSSNPARLQLSKLATPTVVVKPGGYDRAAAALVARVGQALPVTLDEINKVLTTEFGAPTDLRVSGSLSDLLSILAGRAFLLPTGTPIYDGAGNWLGGSQVGSFLKETKPSTYWIFPAHPGPMTKLDPVPSEIGPVRRTYPGAVVDSSILKGQLAKLTQGIRIPGNRKQQSRVVVVYDQDGQVVA